MIISRLKIGLALLVIVMSYHRSDGQTIALECAMRGPFERAMLDNLGNVYTIRGSEVMRFDVQCQQLFRHSDLMLGRIDLLDASNPMKLLLFYRDFSKVVFLDNTLSPSHNPIDLRPLGLNLATLACTSFDNGMWVYDAVNYRLVRFNQQMHPTSETVNLDLIVGRPIDPKFMTESADRLYLYDPAFGVFVLDMFGTFVRSIPHSGADQFVAYGDLLMFRHHNRIETLDIERLREGQFTIASEDIRHFDARKGVLVVAGSLGTERYKLGNNLTNN